MLYYNSETIFQVIHISLRQRHFVTCVSQRVGLSVLVWQLMADILTVSRDNSILFLSCFFKINKYISECWFCQFYYKTVLLSKKVIFQVKLTKK